MKGNIRNPKINLQYPIVNYGVLIIIAVVLLSILASRHIESTKTVPVFICNEVVAVKARPIALAPTIKSIAPLPILPPRVLSTVQPIYPQSALQKGIEGVVIVQADIVLSGIPQNVKIKSSSGDIELDESAIAAVSQWKFSPALQGAAGINSVFEVPIRFEINDQ